MSAAPHDHLILFARWPEPGRTKTRLIPALGAAGAAELQRRMTLQVLRTALGGDRQVEVRFEGGDAPQMAATFGTGPTYSPQGDGDLGARLGRAVDAAFGGGAKRVVVVGTDCPALRAAQLTQAFDALARADLVLGPATDGGYYLLGVAAPQPALFDRIAWSTASVLAETLARAAAQGLWVQQLEALSDVDRPADLPHAEAALERTLSVIVPTRYEGARLGPTLDRIAACGDPEILVADAGSTDETLASATERGVRIIQSAPGRAAQMNAGAAASYGGLLLFCHADTHLPADYETLARDALATPAAVVGAFDLALRGDERALRHIERAVAWRSRRLQSPYGDQAIFLRRTIFERLGGYTVQPIMEDHDLIRRAKRLGRVVIAAGSASTSARFWRKHGMLGGTVRNQAVLLGARLGLSPERLARWRAGTRVEDA